MELNSFARDVSERTGHWSACWFSHAWEREPSVCGAPVTVMGVMIIRTRSQNPGPRTRTRTRGSSCALVCPSVVCSVVCSNEGFRESILSFTSHVVHGVERNCSKINKTFPI